jgi:NosR/NirI family nitrous oxide reductase transcriptional regulator
MRAALFLAATLLGAAAILAGQAPTDALTLAQLKKLFPAATGFSPKEGDIPLFKAYSGDPKSPSPAILGYAFYTTELQPLERAYDGPIKWLVGMNTSGVLTGVVLVEHKEPFGNFSIETAEFQNTFKNKNIRDNFKVGADIDAIARATISMASSARAIRNSARRVARALLAPPGAAAR